MAIVKAMEALENTNIRNSMRRMVTIYTDSKVNIQSIKNYRNHKSLIEKICHVCAFFCQYVTSKFNVN